MLLVVQVLDVFPCLRLRAADEIPCHLMVVEPSLRMILIRIAVLPPHLPVRGLEESDWMTPGDYWMHDMKFGCSWPEGAGL